MDPPRSDLVVASFNEMLIPSRMNVSFMSRHKYIQRGGVVFVSFFSKNIK